MGAVLIVDDSAPDRALLRTILGRAGYTVYEVARGGEAVQKAREVRPHIIILDVNLPDLNGLDVARQLTRFFPEIPILMITIHLSKQLSEEARRVGIRGACAKSDVSSIVEAVDALLHAGTYFPTMSSEISYS